MGIDVLADPKGQLKRRLVGISLGVATVGTAWLLSQNPDATESVYAAKIAPWIASNLSKLSGRIPFSIGEVLIGLFVLRQVVGVFRGCLSLRKPDHGLLKLLGKGSLRFLSDAGVLITMFYLFWGFNYFRPPILERLAWEESDITVAELSILGKDAVAATNLAYVKLHGSPDLGISTPDPDNTLFLEEAIDEGFRRASTLLGEPRGVFREFGRAKPLFVSSALHYLGLSGFYFPWTGEAGYNRTVPAVDLPQVMAHEKAHQRGFARENEANFMGFVVCVKSPDPLAQYSAALFAQQQILSALAQEDVQQYIEIVADRCPGVTRDIEDRRKYWKAFENKGSKVARSVNMAARTAAVRVNDAYLKSQKVEGGVRSYTKSLYLIVAYLTRNGPASYPWLLGANGLPGSP